MNRVTPIAYVLTFIVMTLSQGGNLWAQLDSSDFVFSVNTTNPGLSNNSSYVLNLNHPSTTYNVDIDWNNDGIFDSIGVSNTIMHSYSIPGIHTIRLRGQFPVLRLGTDVLIQSDRSKLIAVDQWGKQQWSDVSLMFRFCDSLLTTPLDTPDFSMVSSTGSMFYGAKSFNGPVNHWDMSGIFSMNLMFFDAESFNQPVNDWDLASMSFASRMFAGASSFNQAVDNWNLPLAFDLSHMFEGAASFNQSINSWDIPNCQSLFSMFLNASSYNQPMDSINLASVVDLGRMFEGASSFDQDLSNWDFSNASSLFRFLDSSAMSVSNYDKLLNHCEVNYLNKNLTLGAGGLEYCMAQNARANLISNGWMINGDSLENNCTITKVETRLEKGKTPFLLYPNPSSGRINIEFKSLKRERIIVYDTKGRSLLESEVNQEKNELILDHLNDGVYSIKIGDLTRQFVLIR